MNPVVPMAAPVADELFPGHWYKQNNGASGADDLHLAEDGRGIAKFRDGAKKTKQKIDGRGGAG